MTALGRPLLLQLQLDGQPLPGGVQAGLMAVQLLQRASLPAVCELRFLAELPAVQPGASLVLNLDTAGLASAPLFAGEVTAVTLGCPPGGGRELHVRAYDALHRLRRHSPLLARSDVRLSEVALDLAGRAGLTLDLEDGLPDPVWPSHLQAGSSDLEVLTTLAGRVGAYVSVQGEQLKVFGLKPRPEPLNAGQRVLLRLGSELLEATTERNVDGLRDGLCVSGWNPRRASAVTGRANAGVADPLRAAAGSGDRELLGGEHDSDDHARLLAQAELDHAAASAWTVQAVASGNALLRPGADVEIAGLDAGWNGVFRLMAVTHTFDARLGFISEIGSRPPARPVLASGAAGAGAVATLGLVTDVQDPAGLGRVRVTLPAYGDLMGEWTPVVCVAAGTDKGLMALPDTGDRVLVLLTHGDPAQGVVLGGLYGESGFSDPGLTPDGIRRLTLRTAGGELLMLDGQRGGLTLKDRAGSTLEFLPEGVRLTACADLLLEAPGRRIVVRADRIDFERG